MIGSSQHRSVVPGREEATRHHSSHANISRIGCALASATLAVALASGCGPAIPPGWEDVVMMSSGFAPVTSAETTSPPEGEGGWTRREWSIPEKSPLLGWYAISSFSPSPRPFRLVALVDYQQVEVDVQGYAARSQDVTVPANVRVEQLLRIDGLHPGRHELLTVLFADPMSNDFSSVNEMEFDDAGYIAQRMMVGVGEDDATATLSSLASLESTPSGSGFDGVVVNQSATPDEKITVVDARAGEPIDLLAHFGNAGPDQLDIAAFGLLDWEQTALDARGATAYRLRVPGHSFATVPIRVIAPSAAGIHQLVVLRAADPLRSLEATFFPQDRVAASLRLVLRVR